MPNFNPSWHNPSCSRIYFLKNNGFFEHNQTKCERPVIPNGTAMVTDRWFHPYVETLYIETGDYTHLADSFECYKKRVEDPSSTACLTRVDFTLRLWADIRRSLGSVGLWERYCGDWGWISVDSTMWETHLWHQDTLKVSYLSFWQPEFPWKSWRGLRGDLCQILHRRFRGAVFCSKKNSTTVKINTVFATPYIIWRQTDFSFQY